MAQPIDQKSLDTLFREARTLRKWRDKPVPESLLRQLYDLTILGPTSGNCLPSRFVFVVTPEGKERLVPHLTASNVDSTRAAPATIIVATDTEFWKEMPADGKFTKIFAGMGELAQTHGFRNGTLQGGYLILAARALGLDAGAMSGFDHAAVDGEFFADGRFKSNFLCNVGYGDHAELAPRPPRPAFEAVCTLA